MTTNIANNRYSSQNMKGSNSLDFQEEVFCDEEEDCAEIALEGDMMMVMSCNNNNNNNNQNDISMNSSSNHSYISNSQ